MYDNMGGRGDQLFVSIKRREDGLHKRLLPPLLKLDKKQKGYAEQAWGRLSREAVIQI